jgi:hypothetical protein
MTIFQHVDGVSVDGTLSADADGRAKMGSGFFDSATVSDKFDAGSIALPLLAESVIQADGGQAFTADQSMGGFKLTSLGSPTGPADATPKSYVDAIASGLDWQPSADVLFFVGTRTIVQIDALVPAAGWSVVAGDSGTPAAGVSDALTTGDISEFDGTSWKLIVDAVGGFPPDGSRAVVAWPSSTTIYSPLVDGVDEGKVAEWDGSSLSPSLVSPEDGWAVLCAGARTNPPTAYNENKQFSFAGVVPAGSWVQVGGPIPYGTSIQTVGAANLAGVSANLSRDDHVHKAPNHVRSTWDTSGLTVGAPVYPTTTAATVAHADASTVTTSKVIGLVGTVGASGDVVTHGLVTAIFAGGDLGWANGAPIFLSPTTGRVTFTAPAASGETVIELGYLRDGTGLSATTVDGETASVFFNVGPVRVIP